MKNLKASIILVACLFGVTAMQPVARAMLTSIPDSGSYTTRLAPFNSYLGDMGHSGEAPAGIVNFPFGSGSDKPTMDYTPDMPAHCSFGTLAAINFSDSEIARIFLRMLPNYYVPEIAVDDITFPSCDLTHSIAVGHDLFQSLCARGIAGQPVSIAISSTEDLADSDAPVSASTLLLFTGLIGLIGFRRRMMNR